MREYSLEEKLSNKDLHGLKERIPKPIGKQKDCEHTEFIKVDRGYEDWDSGEWIPNIEVEEHCAMKDVAGTNNIRCPRCGYTRRY